MHGIDEGLTLTEFRICQSYFEKFCHYGISKDCGS